MKYVRLFEDSTGESHFEDVEEKLKPADFAPPAPPLNVSAAIPALQMIFLSAPAGWLGDWHPSPVRQFIFVVAGELELEASDGEVRRFRTGDVAFAADVIGKGHCSRAIGDEIFSAVIVQLE